MSEPICLYCGHLLHRGSDLFRQGAAIVGCLRPGCGYSLPAESFVFSATGEYREVLLAGARRTRA